MSPRGASPAGTDAVRCAECGAEARAFLTHDQWCTKGRIYRLPEWARSIVNAMRSEIKALTRDLGEAKAAADVAAGVTRDKAGPFAIEAYDRTYGTPVGASVSVNLPRIVAEIDETADGAIYVSTVHTLHVLPLSSNSVQLIEEDPREQHR